MVRIIINLFLKESEKNIKYSYLLVEIIDKLIMIRIASFDYT